MFGSNDVEMGRTGQETKPLVHLAVESARRGFVRKVYGLVAVQLGLTALIATPIAMKSDAWIEDHFALFTCCSMGLLVLAVSLSCCSHLLRQHPTNLVILAAFTVMESVTVGFFSAMYEMQSVVLCLFVTAAVAGALTAVAFNTKIDATGLGAYLRATSLALFFVGLAGFFLHAPIIQLVYAAGGAALFAGYLVYDTQLVVGGKNKQKQFSIDDYVLAALSIYMDLVRLFIFILRLLGDKRGSRR